MSYIDSMVDLVIWPYFSVVSLVFDLVPWNGFLAVMVDPGV